tara:strand:+ start:47 stop:256 length:210 start_codon:yes stop_codon:yes gene_type:complete
MTNAKTKIFVNDLAFYAYKRLRTFFQKNPSLAEGDPDRDAMMIVGNICMDNDKLYELLKVIDVKEINDE